jgi:subtilase family serine protease
MNELRSIRLLIRLWAILTLVLSLLLLIGVTAKAEIVNPPLSSDSNLVIKVSFDDTMQNIKDKYSFESDFEGWQKYTYVGYIYAGASVTRVTSWSTDGSYSVQLNAWRQYYVYDTIAKIYKNDIVGFVSKFEFDVSLSFSGISANRYFQVKVNGNVVYEQRNAGVYHVVIDVNSNNPTIELLVYATGSSTSATAKIDNIKMYFVKDEAGTVDHGQIVGSVTQGDGLYGYSLDMDGSNYVEITPLSDYFSGSYTILFWASDERTNKGTHDPRGLFEARNTATGEYIRLFSSNGYRIEWDKLPGEIGNIGYDNAFPDTDIHLIAVTFDKSTNTAKLFVDGILVATKNVDMSLSGVDRIRLSAYHTKLWIGKFDEFRLYTRALSDSEVKSVTEAMRLLIYDELTLSKISATANAISGSSTYPFQIDIDNEAILFYNQIPSDGIYKVEAFSDDYYKRTLNLQTQEMVKYKVFLISKSSPEAISVPITINDLYDQYPDKTQLSYIIKKDFNEGGSLVRYKITEGNFDASGKAYVMLQNNAQYYLEIYYQGELIHETPFTADSNGYTVILDDAPELVVTDIIPPSEIALRQDNVITVVVQNTGELNADTFTVLLQANGQTIGSTRFSLTAGDTKTVNFVWRPTTIGTYDLTATVDVNNEVKEKNENNNARTESVTVYAPDLIVEAINTPSNIVLGEDNSISVTVRNTGNKIANNFNVKLEANGNLIGTKSVSSLSAGSLTAVSFTWVPSSTGSFTLTATVDPEDSILENDENNNALSISATVVAPDLTVTNLILPQNIVIGENNLITVEIKNNGDYHATNIPLEVKANGQTIGSAVISALAVGSTTTVDITWKPTSAGSHTITATVDPGNSIKEHNENNNEYSSVVEVLAPDLTISNIVTPQTPILGQSEQITVYVKNEGTYHAQNIEVRLYINDVLEGSQTVTILDSGQEDSIVFSWTPEEVGVINIRAEVDPLNSITESNEGNNTKTETVNSLAPDLTITNFEVPENIVIGNSYQLNITLENKGSYQASNFKVVVKEGEHVIRQEVISSIQAGESITLAVTYSPSSSGDVSFSAIADSEDTVVESNESNNSIDVTRTVYAPDLILESVNSEGVLTEQGYTINITVRNAGNYAVGGFRVELTENGESIGEKYISSLNAGESIVESITFYPSVGSHTVIATVDPENSILESNEDNNEMSYTFSVDGVDLRPVSIEVESSINLGESAEVIVNIENLGNINPNNWTVILWEEDKMVASTTSNQTAVKLNYTPTVRGTYILTAEVVSNGVEDYNPTNNKMFAEVTVVSPDLTVTLSTPSTVDEGKSFTVTAVVINQGDVKAQNFDLTVAYNGNEQKKMALTVEPSQTLRYSFTFTASRDWTTVVAVVDPDDRVSEFEEDNNRAEASMKVRYAELNIWIDASSYAVLNSPVNIKVGISNAGDLSGTGTITVTANGETLGSKGIAVEPGEVEHYYYSYTPKPEDYSRGDKFTVVANLESDSGDDSDMQFIRVLAPDLRVMDIETPAVLKLGEEHIISVSVENAGDYRAENIKVKLYVNGTLIGEKEIDSLEQYENRSVSFKWIPETTGTFNIEAVVDEDNKIAEWDEDNNKMITTTVKAPDLVITNYSVPEDMAQYSTYTIEVSVENQGTVDADRFVISLNDSYSTKTQEINLSAGEIKLLNFTYTPMKNGTINFSITLDIENEISELDEENNIVNFSTFVKGPEKNVTVSANAPPSVSETTLKTVGWGMWIGYGISAVSITYGTVQLATTGGELGRRWLFGGIAGVILLGAISVILGALGGPF